MSDMLFKSLQDRAWALHPAKLDEIGAFLDRRLAGEKSALPEMPPTRRGDPAEEAYQIIDGVAVLPVSGIIDKRMNMLMRFSGGTSTELLARDFKKALADPKVDAILLDVDSPGGSVDGPKDLADLIYAARGQKPVVAFANGLMASAAYWIGSAAGAVVANATAEVGSIGVAAMHYDYSSFDEKAGIKRTAIYAGKYKRIASDEKPLSEEGKDYLQGIIDDYYALFLQAVARNRDADIDLVQKKMADGRIFIGKKALKAGLVDRIGDFNEALALARAQGGAMPDKLTKAVLEAQNPELVRELLAEGAASVTPEALLAQHPDAAEALRLEGEARERSRTVEILETAGLAGLSLQVIKDGTQPKEAFKLFLAHQDQVKAEALKALLAEAPPPLGSESPRIETYAEPEADAPVDKQARAEWDKDSNLAKEFGQFETYLAFRQAEVAGQAKILRK